MPRLGNIVNSIKHYVQTANGTIASGAIGTVSLVKAEVAPANAAVADVLEGSIVKAIYIEMWMIGNGADGSDTQFNYIIYKLPSGLASPTYTNILNLQAWDNKKNVFFHSQGVIGDAQTQAIPVYRQWLKIPKGKQRMGAGDRIAFAVAATGQTINRCGFATYKEYR